MRSCSYPECKKNPGEKGDLAGVLNTLPNKDRAEVDSPREGNELITDRSRKGSIVVFYLLQIRKRPDFITLSISDENYSNIYIYIVI